MGRAFISYKTNAKPDDRLAKFFAEYLSSHNHEIFIQTKITPGQNWPSIVDQNLKVADFLIVLLSDQSGSSEMVIEEVRRAAHLKETQGHPVIIPVHLANQVTMPYDLGAKVNRLERLKWLTDGDEKSIAQKLNDALSTGQVAAAAQPAPQPKAAALSADGSAAQTTKDLACPLPSFDVSWLRSLDAQGGPVRLDSPFYVERPHDQTGKQRIVKKGTTLLIRGNRQIGKTSLLARLYQHARDQHVPSVYIDFQMFDHTQLESLDKLLLAIGNQIGDDLNANSLPDGVWKTTRTSGQNLTRYLQDEIIGTKTDPTLLLMDEVDRLFSFPEYQDFFGLVRSWDSQRPFNARLAHLNLVLAYSTEASMFIKNPNQSPFNVGEIFELSDFTRTQFEDLNFKHGSPLKNPADIDAILNVVGGHPFLVRQSFYELASSPITVGDLIASAANDDGPFGGHLQSYLLRFHEYGDLREPMKSVLKNGVCPDDVSFYRLRSVGLVRGPDRTHVAPRCGLYNKYFGARL